MSAVKNANEVRVEKLIKRPAKDVFLALAEGRLFNNCGASMEHMKLDFRVGGGYQLGFHNGELKVCGKFTEIVPERKIRFTWGDDGSDKGFPFTVVVIELFADGDKTRVVIEHTGFETKEDAESHDYGWNTGLNDLTPELVDGRLRLLRVYPVSRERLFAVCSDFHRFCADGELLESLPGEKIVFSWPLNNGELLEKTSRVTLLFEDEDDGASCLSILHEELPLDLVKARRSEWESLAGENLRQVL